MNGREIGTEAMHRLRLRSACAIDPGLTDTECDRIEQEFGFRFADDHRAFLAAGLPVNTWVHTAQKNPWPDWRNEDHATLQRRLDRPAAGVLFDVEHNNFWYAAWGPRPTEPATAVAVARQKLTQVPTMVPVYAHRYLPSGREAAGHPVLSIWQTDIIYYGLNLPDYIDHEFGSGTPDDNWNPVATVPFWKDLC